MSAQQRLLVPLTKENLDDLKKQAPEVFIDNIGYFREKFYFYVCIGSNSIFKRLYN